MKIKRVFMALIFASAATSWFGSVATAQPPPLPERGQVAISPDGKMAVTSAKGSWLEFWDLTSGLPTKAFSLGKGQGCNVAFTPDGKHILCGTDDHLAIVDIQTEKTTQSFPGHRGGVIASQSSDGKLIVSAGSQETTLTLWDVDSGKRIRTFADNAHPGGIAAVALSGDGKHALSCGGNLVDKGGPDDRTIKLWEVATGKVVRDFGKQQNVAQCISFSPDGRQALSADKTGLVKIWDVNRGKVVRTIPCIPNLVGPIYSCVAGFLPSGRYIVTSMPFCLWEVATGKQALTFKTPPTAPRSFALSPDGKRALSLDNRTLMLWDVKSGEEIMTLDGFPGPMQTQSMDLAFSADDKAALSVDYVATILWDVATGKERRSFGNKEVIIAFAALSPNGKLLLSTDDGRRTKEKEVGLKLRLWDVATGKQIRSFDGTNRDSHVVFSPDGELALTGGEDGRGKEMRLWDVSTGKLIRAFDEPDGNPILRVAFSSDGKQCAGLYFAGLRIWNVASGKLVTSLGRDWQRGPVDVQIKAKLGACEKCIAYSTLPTKIVAYSPDGKKMLGVWGRGSLAIWEGAENKPSKILVGKGVLNVLGVDFSHDGKLAICGAGDRTFKLWDLETGREVRTFEKPEAKQPSPQGSPQG